MASDKLCKRDGIIQYNGEDVISAYDLETRLTEGLIQLPDVPEYLVWQEKLSGSIASMFFESTMATWPEGQKFWQYKTKSSIKSMNLGVGSDGNKSCYAYWYERVVGEKESHLESEAAAGQKKIVVADPERVGGFVEDLTIKISLEDGKLLEAVVVNVEADGKTLTLKDNLPVKVPANSKVFRGVYNASFEDCNPDIKDQVNFRNNDVKMYKSFYRTLFKKIEFRSDCLIRVPNIGNYIDDKSKSLQLAADIAYEHESQLNEMFNEFIHTIWFDKNMVWSTKDGGKYAETMGFFPAALSVKDSDGNLVNVVNLKGCCDEDDCGSMRKSIQAFLSVVYNIQSVGHAYKDRKVYCVVNQAQREIIERLKPYFMSLNNEVVTVTRDEANNPQSNLGMFTYSYLGMTIVFQYEESLNQFDRPIMIVMPEGTVGVVGLDRQTLVNIDNNGKPIFAEEKPVLSGGSLNIQWDREQTKYSKLSRCLKLVAFVEYAIVWLFMDKGVYKIIEGFEPCGLDECKVCDQGTHPVESPYVFGSN